MAGFSPQTSLSHNDTELIFFIKEIVKIVSLLFSFEELNFFKFFFISFFYNFFSL